MMARFESAVRSAVDKGMQKGQDLRRRFETVTRDTAHDDLQDTTSQIHADVQSIVKDTLQTETATPGSPIDTSLRTAAKEETQEELAKQITQGAPLHSLVVATTEAAADHTVQQKLAPGEPLRHEIVQEAVSAVPAQTDPVDTVLQEMQTGSTRRGDFETAIQSMVPAPPAASDPVPRVIDAMANPATRAPFDAQIARVADQRIADATAPGGAADPVHAVLQGMQTGSPRHDEFETAIQAIIPSVGAQVVAAFQDADVRRDLEPEINGLIHPAPDPVVAVTAAMADPATRGPFDAQIARVVDARIAAAGGVPTSNSMNRRTMIGVSAGTLALVAGALICGDWFQDTRGWPWSGPRGIVTIGGGGTTTINQITPNPSNVTPEIPVINFPVNSSDASARFGTDTYTENSSNWDQNAQGGWHLREDSQRHTINPQEFVAEGYFDAGDRTPQPEVSNGITFQAQGATIWPVTGTHESQILWNKVKQNTGKTPWSIGFNPDPSVGTG